MWGSHEASLINSAQWLIGDSMMDRWMERQRQTDGWIDGQKNTCNVALAHLQHREVMY